MRDGVRVIDLTGTDCIAYLRVSTERQSGEVYTSIADQEAAVRALAAKLGRTIGHVFTEPGASGSTIEGRPALRSLIASCEAAPRPKGAPGLVLVLNDSRWGRFENPEEATYWRVHLSRIPNWHVRFAEGDQLDADKHVRSILRAVHQSQATAHRDAIRANVRRGSRGSAAQGFWGTREPFGYRRKVVYPPGRERVLPLHARKAADERVVLVPEPDEAAIVRELFHRYASGVHSLASLVEWLLQVAPLRKWTRAAVRVALKNPAYAGDVVSGRTTDNGSTPMPETEWIVTRNAHEAIISRALFDEVQARLTLHRRRTRGVWSDWILSGLVHCRCGAPFAAGGGGGRSGRLPSYRCVTRGAHPSARCPYPGTVMKTLLEAAVLDTLAATIGTTDRQRRIVAEIDRQLRALRERPERSLAALRTEETTLAAKRDRLVQAIADGVVSDVEARGQLAGLRQQLARVMQRREALEAATTRERTLDQERERLIALALDFPRAIRKLTGPRLREAIRPWIHRAVFNTTTRVLTLEVRHVPASGVSGDSLGSLTSVGDSTQMAHHPDQKHDRAAVAGGSATTRRRVVIGRRRA